MTRFDPIQYFDQGGTSIGQMQESADGDYVRAEDARQIYDPLAALVARFDELSENDHHAIGRDLIAAARTAIERATAK
jgi:hypothetical protein